jgi:hypothetical protein
MTEAGSAWLLLLYRFSFQNRFQTQCRPLSFYFLYLQRAFSVMYSGWDVENAGYADDSKFLC